MKYILDKVAAQLLEARQRSGLSQRALAKMARTTQSRISRVENGDVDMRISTLVELARNLDLELMLIPRRHVGAVKAIISQRQLSTVEKSLRTSIKKLHDLVSRLRERFPEDTQVTQLMRIVTELSNLKLRSADLNSIKKAMDTLNLIEQTPALIGAVREPTEDLRRLRNTRAQDIHADDGVPRPAYLLEDEPNG